MVRFALAIAAALALLSATVRLPAAECISNQVVSGKACHPACCANKACCETSPERTTPPVQPLAKPGAEQQILAVPPTFALLLPFSAIASPRYLASARPVAHSTAPFALICIRLI